jgi:hypothetical protein
MINYNGKTFRPVTNSGSGEVDTETLFHYSQEGNIVTGTYTGGSIRHGQLIALVDGEGGLNMRYHHVNTTGELLTGVCRSVLRPLPSGKMQLHETWHWTSGREGMGTSIIEEVT